jgi:hypothetical protein
VNPGKHVRCESGLIVCSNYSCVAYGRVCNFSIPRVHRQSINIQLKANRSNQLISSWNVLAYRSSGSVRITSIYPSPWTISLMDILGYQSASHVDFHSTPKSFIAEESCLHLFDPACMCMRRSRNSRCIPKA